MKGKKTAISHADIAKAIKKFQKQGGLIKRLPDQVVPKGVLVGGKFGMYESIFEPGATGSGTGGGSGLDAAAAE
jgi:hypothetical protein